MKQKNQGKYKGPMCEYTMNNTKFNLHLKNLFIFEYYSVNCALKTN